MTTTASKIKELRRMKSMTQHELGKKIGVSGQQVQKYEDGKNSPSLEGLCKIAEVFKVHPIELIPHAENVQGDIDVLGVSLKTSSIPLVIKFISAINKSNKEERRVIERFVGALGVMATGE